MLVRIARVLIAKVHVGYREVSLHYALDITVGCIICSFIFHDAWKMETFHILSIKSNLT